MGWVRGSMYHIGFSDFLMYSGSTMSLDVAVSQRLQAAALDRGQSLGWMRGKRGVLPLQLLLLVIASEPLVVCGHHVVALGLGNDGLVLVVVVREEHVGAVLVEPAELLAAQGEDAAQDQTETAVWVLLGVGERECRAPGAAEDDPLLDFEERA
jgi:hypothetical protein